MKVVIALVVILALYCIWLTVDMQQKSDEERKEMGFGPKGQGR